ncbi:MAG TPA: excinuclease ABC subunit UvrC [Thermoanaerobaculia bacterium]|nr:excinuclease ABC subunit UvrC [Thermoanaerobaculia bacterium]
MGNESENRQQRLRNRIGELPERPGVYLHKNRSGEVIYVGKARNLRSRVGSYLVGKGWRDVRTMTLVGEIEEIDFVTTNNELEAILLENNLIKTHQPRYNVLLRDDKTYPYLKVTLSEPYPRVVFTRRVDRSRGDLYFGPFFAGTARRILKVVTDQFKLRSCDLEIEEGKSALSRPCLYYDMHQCPGPCVAGLTSRAAYMEMVDDVVLFLSGKARELQERLKERMYRAAGDENYEIAGYYRDLIRTTERLQSEQQVASSGGETFDVWGFHEESGDIAIQLFIMRDGNLVDRRELFWEKVEEPDRALFLSEVLQRYYLDNLFIPPEILVPFTLDEEELLAEFLTSQRGRRAVLRRPQRGRGVDLVELATRNAKIAHDSRFRKSQQERLQTAATRLGQLLGHSGPVDRIESFDISNFQGTDSVAGMVVFESGKFDRKQYRTFNIRSVEGADDFRSMAEAVERRYRRILEEGRPLPEMILIDGGRGQLNAAISALSILGIEGVTAAGLAKREEEIHLPDTEEPIRLERHDPALQLLQMIRDETHRFAVSSHRRRRSRRTLRSELDDLQGIGDKRRRLLLEHFGSLSAVRQASPQDLAKVLGRKIGKAVYDQLHTA